MTTKKKFKATWNEKLYNKCRPKIVHMDQITIVNGFEPEDVVEIDSLSVGGKYVETHPLGEGFTMERLE